MNELDIRIAVLAQGIEDKAIAGRLTDRHWRLAARKTGRSILKVGELVKRMEMDVCLLTDYDATLCHKLASPSNSALVRCSTQAASGRRLYLVVSVKESTPSQLVIGGMMAAAA